jgi:alpha-L-fucosidase
MRYQPSWNSLKNHRTPRWFQDVKFGIYTHWGIYSVPAYGPNATWYPYNMYRQGTPQHEHHVKTYGDPAQFGYKDLVPLFTGRRFDADQWAELFRKAGARFAGPVGEHHDGFAMWDSHLTEWNARRMGPKRDVVGELAKACRDQGMRFMVAMHHAENWWFFPHWATTYDTADPRYAELYGPPHNLDWANGLPPAQDRNALWRLQDRPSEAFLERWLGKVKEVVDNYQPDLLWFDFGLQFVQEHYKRQCLAYYYNKAEEWGKEVVVTYKWHDLAPNCAVVDLELGRFPDLTYQEWITDTTVDDGHGWGYLKETAYKSASTLVHALVDNVSKNGYMLLNVGPRPDGEIPEQVQDILLEIGRWLEVNGEAIYGTTPWTIYGEGPTSMVRSGPFSEDVEVQYTAEDIRFTVKDDVLYALCLGWPGQQITIKSAAERLYPSEIDSIHMLGAEEELGWAMTPAGLTIETPARRPCDHAYTFRIARKHPFGNRVEHG